MDEIKLFLSELEDKYNFKFKFENCNLFSDRYNEYFKSTKYVFYYCTDAIGKYVTEFIYKRYIKIIVNVDLTDELVYRYKIDIKTRDYGYDIKEYKTLDEFKSNAIKYTKEFFTH